MDPIGDPKVGEEQFDPDNPLQLNQIDVARNMILAVCDRGVTGSSGPSKPCGVGSSPTGRSICRSSDNG